VKLEIGNFHVKSIRFGSQTAFKDGVLTVNKEEAIAAVNPDKKLKNIDLHIVRPGDNVRMLPVKDVVEPRVRPDGRPVFPGYSGPFSPCGDGVVHALKDMSVIVVGKYGGWMDGLLDMSGPAAEMTMYSKLINLVIVAEEVDMFRTLDEKLKSNTYFRLTAHLLAEYVGAVVKDQQPEDWERYELGKVGGSLPKVALVMHLMTFKKQREGLCTLFYGFDASSILPTLTHPNEVLDGALVSDVLSIAGSRFATYDFQNFPLIKSLYREHGKTIELAGVILGTQETTAEGKDRDANRVANIAGLLGCDGAIVVKKGCGNVDIDLFNSIIRLEEIGIKTVGAAPVSTGRDGSNQPFVTVDPRADAITCGGCEGEIIELPPMETVLGDLHSIGRDGYPGAWTSDPVYGPSLREDGSLIIDVVSIFESDGCAGWSNKTTMEF